MSMKYMVGGAVAVSALVLAVSAFAKTAPSAASIACVGSAVAAREASLDAAINTHSTAINTAYTTRASALADAYSKTSVTDIRSAVKLAWSSFNVSVKNAAKDWHTAQQGAWTTFKTAARACKDTSGVSSLESAGHEVSGN